MKSIMKWPYTRYRKNLKAFVMGTILLLLFGPLLSACNDPRGDTNCIPKIFPTGDRSELESYEVGQQIVSEPFDKVIEFFSQELQPNPVSSIEVLSGESWWRERIDESSVVYRCHSVYDNRYDAEYGCVYVAEEGQETVIKWVWYFSPSAECSYDLGLEESS